MFAVTGAAGQLGRLTIQHLLQHLPPSAVLALTRDPARLADLAEAGVTVRHADFADPDSLPTAFAGATRLLLISVNNVFTGPRVAQHRAAIAAAVAVGVGYIAYTSALGADPAAASSIARDHGLTEEALALSGVAWTALRNGFYADSLAPVIARSVAGATLLFPEGSATIPAVTRDDCARVAAAVLAGSADVTGPVDVTSPMGLPLDAIAARLSAVHGRPIAVRPVPVEAYSAQLIAAGLPAAAATALGELIETALRARPGMATDTVRLITGTPAAPVDAALRSLAGGATTAEATRG